jgi:hypothetical protein
MYCIDVFSCEKKIRDEEINIMANKRKMLAIE